MTAPFWAAHRQLDHRVRFDWGPTGAAAIAEGADVAVVVDVLSFTTTLCVAVERGMTVLPYRWKDDGAAAYAEERSATLAVGRLEARSLEDAGGTAVSLSPGAMSRASGVDRVVLPSPNGSSIAFGLADEGCVVLGACLRNRTAVARWLHEWLDEWLDDRGGTIAVVAAGERWPDDSLRPAVEDLWGAGSVLALLDDVTLSPEARVAADAFRAVEATLDDALRSCASGGELADAGFAEDVDVAAQLDASHVVPVMDEGEFRANLA
ncbi:MAG TPA: 2-phosphosulfolactate phosphatase [Nocardioides bacterium]|uniref:2-phosphosulfolactate phosphatase n=1 Tax=uncultured Nocardioides sp. TaxID=198441 RepID=UPI000EC8A348|nr:2-phosphosulfolactate phosphatase [uncultured Nocardioides sp.]HCB06310.1 2-phosphosulfolactate phosphatase [Nocardioides sp.]